MKKWLTNFACISPVLFVIITTIIGFITPDYNHLSMTVSRLSLGMYGWIQSINFILFAIGLFIASELLSGNARNRGTKIILHKTFLVTAVTLTLLAIFPTDPIDSFPKEIFALNWTALVHFLLVAVYTLLTPLAIRILVYTFQHDAQFKHIRKTTAILGTTSFILSIIWFGFFYFGILNGFRGLIQKIIFLEVLYWLTLVMNRLKAQAPHGFSASTQELS